MTDQQVLRSPFDIETHKKTFINYLEVIILKTGEIVYAVPSHQEKLIALACKELTLSRDELNDLCPEEYYFDFMVWLCQISGAIAVWNAHTEGKINELQRTKLLLLRDEGLYRGYIP